MKQLHWGDTLAGHPVTPESWIYGIVEKACAWEGWYYVYRQKRALAERTPIYPPRGFGGLSERELWQAMTGRPSIDPYITADSEETIVYTPEWEVGVSGHAVTVKACMEMEYGSAAESLCLYPDDALALILALDNALALSKRLKER